MGWRYVGNCQGARHSEQKKMNENTDNIRTVNFNKFAKKKWINLQIENFHVQTIAAVATAIRKHLSK